MTSRIHTHTQIKRNHDRDALVKFPVESRSKKVENYDFSQRIPNTQTTKIKDQNMCNPCTASTTTITYIQQVTVMLLEEITTVCCPKL